MIIITDKIVFGGKSIGKIDGKTVFLSYSLPGETLDVNIVESKSDYDNAEITKIIKPSPYRVEPKCKYYGKCGGCNMMHIDPKYQVELRKQILCDIFNQEAIDIKNSLSIVTGPEFNYRARFQLNNGGLSQRAGNVIIPITKCQCAEEIVNEYLANSDVNSRPKGRIHLFGSKYVCNKNKLMIAHLEENNKKEVIGKNKKNLKIKENHYFSGTLYSPENTQKVKINGKEIAFDVRGFFQSNLFVFEKVLQLILDNLISGKNILDMYSGCGAISTFLSDKFENVTLVEHNRDALVYAEENMAGKKHVSYGMSGANWVKNCLPYCPSFDACLIDPPRSGMEREVCDFLCKSNIPQILSLSCDPRTHARDCKKLIKAGYKLEKIYLLDFYPNTSHIESLAIFHK